MKKKEKRRINGDEDNECASKVFCHIRLSQKEKETGVEELEKGSSYSCQWRDKTKTPLKPSAVKFFQAHYEFLSSVELKHCLCGRFILNQRNLEYCLRVKL